MLIFSHRCQNVKVFFLIHGSTYHVWIDAKVLIEIKFQFIFPSHLIDGGLICFHIDLFVEHS